VGSLGLVVRATANTAICVPFELGSYNITIDWGDGSSSFVGPSNGTTLCNTQVPGLLHGYGTNGTFNINITGELTLFGAVNALALTWDDDLVSVDFRQSSGLRITSLTGAFSGATSNFLLLGSIPAGITDLSNTFRFAINFDGAGVAAWQTLSVTSMQATFSGAANFTGNISTWNVQNVRSMKEMFSGASAFNGLINGWNTSSVTDMSSTFSYSSVFNQPLANWTVDSVVTMQNMFGGAARFNRPLSNWRTGKVRNMSNMFFLAQLFDQPLASWNVSSVTDMSFMFYVARRFNQPLNSWDTSSVRSVSNMFNQADRFNQPLDQWNVSAVTSFDLTFWSATAFNGSVSNWNTRSASSMSGTFSLAAAFNVPLEQWDVSRVTVMSNMFFATQSFNQPIGSWNTRSVLNMDSMFSGAEAFNQPIGAWNISRVTNMQSMFMSTGSFNQPLTSWNVSSVMRMNQMFLNATKFTGSLRYWCVPSIATLPPFFSNFSLLQPADLPVWGTCPNLPAPIQSGPPVSAVIEVDECQLFGRCPTAPSVASSAPLSPLQPIVVTIPSNTSFLLAGNATTPPNTVIIFRVSSATGGSLTVGSITTNSCLNLTGGQLQLLLESSVLPGLLNGTAVQLISSTNPQCFTEDLPPTVQVQIGATDSCAPLIVTGTKRVDTTPDRVTLAVLLSVRSGPNTCNSPSDKSASGDSPVPIGAIVGSIGAVVVLSVAVAAAVFFWRRRKFASAKRNVQTKLVQNNIK
jgi:surface protein